MHVHEQHVIDGVCCFLIAGAACKPGVEYDRLFQTLTCGVAPVGAVRRAHGMSAGFVFGLTYAWLSDGHPAF
jgi:hypothetical protein